jgi:hypothetical protein
VNQHARLWHRWLRIERLVRFAVRARMRQEPNDAADRALRAVLVQRRAIERAGWFNWFAFTMRNGAMPMRRRG